MQAWLYEFNSETFIYVVLCNQIVGTEWKWWGNGDTPLTCLVSGRGKWWIFLVGGGERCTQLLCPQRRQDLLRGRRSWAAHREGEHQGSAQWQIAGWWLWVIWGRKGPTWGESDSEHLLLHGDFCRLSYPQLFQKTWSWRTLQNAVCIPALSLQSVHTCFQVTHQSTRTKSERRVPVCAQRTNCIL